MKKKNLSEQTAERLYNMVAVEKKIKPGEKLPNELELAADMGVSRTTLRDAIRTLTAQGMLEVRRGLGTFVREKAGEVEDYGFSALDRMHGQLSDLFELRSIVEPAAARLACMRATGGELAEILKCGKAVEKQIRAGKDRTEADREFHTAIVRAAHNEFMLRLLPMISRAVGGAIASGENEKRLAEDTLRDHAMLMDFFGKRDAAGAEHAMAIHMRHSVAALNIGK